MGDQRREIDSKTFIRHLDVIYSSWKTSKEPLWNGADALVLASGSSSDDSIAFKVSSLQLWLLGWEVPDMIIIFSTKEIWVVSSQFKLSIFERLVGKLKEERPDLPPLKLLVRSKTEDAKAVLTSGVIKELKELKAKKIGVFTKEKHRGDLIEGWNSALADSGLAQVDIDLGFSTLLSIKDKIERNNIKTASSISSAVMKRFVIPDLEGIIDKADSIKHSQLAEKVNELFFHPEKISAKLESASQTVEPCFVPIIQSGGKYDLRLSAISNDDTMDFDTIICVLGTRYRSYCASVGRTLFINPTNQQKLTYNLLLEIQEQILKEMRPGVKLSKVMETATEIINQKKPELGEKFLKSCGYGTGVEPKETLFVLDKTNDKTFQDGMVFTLTLGFKGLETGGDNNKPYSLFLVDTVLIEEAKTLLLTESVRSAYKDISYWVEEEEDKLPKKALTDILEPSSRRSKSNDADLQKKLAEEKRREEHQQDLRKRRHEETLKRINENEKSEGKDDSSDRAEKIAYDSVVEYPDAPGNRIFVDPRKEVVFLPVFGTNVPFHVSTIRKASKSGDNDLRILFSYPGVGNYATKLSPHALAVLSFVREMTFRFPDVKVMNNTMRTINEIKKTASARESQKREMQGLAKQKKLLMLERPIASLNKLHIRPTTTTSARNKQGVISAHKNGFRFAIGGADPVDILYENIEHAFFQPSDGDLLVLLHFRLKNAILVGKKKATDIQFYRIVKEVSEKVSTTGGQSLEQELDEEDEEKERVAQTEKEFYNFVKRVEDHVSDFDFDIPYRDLGFYGAPGRANVLLLPTKDCLVQLTEPPFFVLNIADIELANLERVTPGVSKHFDLVFVLKDYAQQVVQIRAIPFSSLESVKDWLDTCDIVTYEGPQTINWPSVMKYIRSDVATFFEEGGWEHWLEAPDEADIDSESEEDEFKPEGDSDVEFDEEDDDEDDYSEDDEGDEDDYSGSEEEDSDEDDWDALERKAKKEDQERGSFDSETRPRSKKNAAYSDSESEEDSDDKRRKPPPKKSSGSSSGARPGAGGVRPGGGSSSGGARTGGNSSGGARPGGGSSSGARPGAGGARPNSGASSGVRPGGSSASSAKPPSKPVGGGSGNQRPSSSSSSGARPGSSGAKPSSSSGGVQQRLGSSGSRPGGSSSSSSSRK